jgi:hypothetical protein
VETFHAEVGCSGVLFNDPYGIPVVVLDDQKKSNVKNLIDRIRQEHDERALACGEVMLAHLKVLLVLATRLKSPTPCGRNEPKRRDGLTCLILRLTWAATTFWDQPTRI